MEPTDNTPKVETPVVAAKADDPPAKPKKPRKPRVKNPTEEKYAIEIGPCKCGCGEPSKVRTKETGRRPVYAKSYCKKVVADARLGGWNEANELTARQFLAMIRAHKNEPTVPTVIEEPSMLQIVNPRICECGCGKPARFHSRTCALDVAKRSKSSKNKPASEPTEQIVEQIAESDNGSTEG